ncbi:hypothetical protein C6I20_12430 [Aeromicrobium sp. A1-2]|uniref:C40 family peptidase n=1 Tax=Aeromicrobium sp. A1-2 TaxID=2107713 RepID=UPI000E48B58D|nr:NlpC/P60 family protein [Aeromicrobium sp. A1-2]AXT85910.1 hypothetical protein C6I20_12430 [Aeromicrobium sp. A1-2]
MRAFPLACRGLAIATACSVALALATTTGASADDPTEAQLQVRLVQSRQNLDNLYAESAAASERLNGAKFQLTEARSELAAQQAELAVAQKQLDAQRARVAELTLQQLQSSTSTTVLTSMLDSQGPQELLERASAYSSVNQAVAARLDALDARQVVHAAAARRAGVALAAQKKAAADQKRAERSIDLTIERAEAAETTTAQERRTLLGQLATARNTSVAEVTRAQDEIDQRLDQSGPGGPVGGDTTSRDPDPTPATPTPSTATSSTSAPTTAVPTTPRPTPPEPPPTPVDPPPAASNKVETAIAYAKKQLGEPYRWGAAGPSSWDCSGLTMRAWQAAGINLPHYAGSQYTRTTKVSVSKIKRGDLLYWSNGSAGSIYHVAMYLGGGQMIQSPRPGRSVEIVSLSYWIAPDLASRPG